MTTTDTPVWTHLANASLLIAHEIDSGDRPAPSDRLVPAAAAIAG